MAFTLAKKELKIAIPESSHTPYMKTKKFAEILAQMMTLVEQAEVYGHSAAVTLVKRLEREEECVRV